MNIFSITMTLISPPYDDGPKNLVIGIARRLKKHSFIFISFLSRRFKEEDNITFIASPFQNGPAIKMSFMQQIFIFFAIFFNFKKIDIFQFFFTPRKYFSIIFKRLLKRSNKRSIQVISSIHSLYDANAGSDIKPLLFSDVIVVHSDYSKARIEGEGFSNVIRIYPGVDLERFNVKNLKKDNFFNEEESGITHVIYPAALRVLERSYSHEGLCKIIMMVKEKIKNVKFVLACKVREKRDARLEEEFKNTSKEFNIENSILFLSTVDDMPSLLNSCDMAIFPSDKGPMGILEIPLVLLEASALSKPVIYSNVPPLNELKQHNIGICLDDMSADSYAKAIIDLAHNKNEQERIAYLSRSAVAKDFTIDNMASQYDAIYNALG